MSDAVRVLLTRVAAEKALPFEVKVQNAAIVAAIQEARKRRLPAFNTVSDLMADLNAEDWGEPTPSAATSGATSEVDIGAIWIGLFHPWFLC